MRYTIMFLNQFADCSSGLQLVILAGLVAASILVFWLGCAPVTRWSLRHIPGPWSLPFLGHLPIIASRDLTFFLQDVAQKYGPIAQVWLGARPWVLLSDPNSIRKVAYRSLARPLASSSFSHMLVGEPEQVDKESDLWNRGAAWKASRRAFESSIMHPDKLAAHVPAIRRCVDRLLAALQPYAAQGSPVDAKRAFGVMSLAVVGEVAYGVDLWPESNVTPFEDENCRPDSTPRVVLAANTKRSSRAGVWGMQECGSVPGAGGSGAIVDPKDGAGGNKKEDSGLVAQLLAACNECLKCLELKSATCYLALQLLLPSLQPLWTWLATIFPDAPQRRHMRARQKVADVSRVLIAQWQAAKEAEASAKTINISDCGSGQMASDGTSGHTSHPFRELGDGISASSFLAAMLEERRRGAVGQGSGYEKPGKGKGADTEGLSSQQLLAPVGRMTDLQVIAQCLTFILGGYDTTSSSLAYTAFLLALHPGVQDKLRSELLAHRGCMLDVEMLGQLPYLDAVIKESQRFLPVGTFFWRELTADVDLGGPGKTIPKGSFVCASIFNVHQDPLVWPHAADFLPERFLDETRGTLGPTHPAAFIPFGSGPRMCVGHRLATMTLKLTLSSLLLRYRLSLHPRQRLPLRRVTGITLTPADGVWLTLTEVDQAS